MVIKFRKKAAVAGIFILAFAIMTGLLLGFKQRDTTMVLGGELAKQAAPIESAGVLLADAAGDYDGERFQRPSKRQALESPYSYRDIAVIPPKVYDNPTDVLYAYYTILQQASNLEGYTGGCGTVGEAEQPYPFAYKLLSDERQNQVSQQAFIDSFRGIGHITFLTLEKAVCPPDTPEDVKYYMIEIETIQGWPERYSQNQGRQTNFTYYYGIATVRHQSEQGWKIDDIDYLAEDFLCAPYHGWSWDAPAMIQIVYQENLQLITQIDGVEQNGVNINIYASGKGGAQYRFEFVRLTNGCDLLLHEFVKEGEKWKEADLLGDTWKGLKFSIHSFKEEN